VAASTRVVDRGQADDASPRKIEVAGSVTCSQAARSTSETETVASVPIVAAPSGYGRAVRVRTSRPGTDVDLRTRREKASMMYHRGLVILSR
jgi:hypothetical protein